MHLRNSLSKKIALSTIVICCTVAAAWSQDIIKPGAKATLLAPGVISTAAGEFAPTFTADRKTVYFTGDPTFICFSKWVNGAWSKPEVTSFSGKWKDMDPFLSPDGKRLFYSSYRPIVETPQSTQQKAAHIWYVDKLPGDKWSAPHHLDAPINLDGINDYAPAVSASGTLYFYSPNRDAANKTTYYCKWLGDHYDSLKIIPIAGEGGVHDPYISPDERFLIFASGGNLYICYQKGGTWGERQKLGPQVNDGAKNSSPCVSPDGKMLYYSSDHANGILMIPVKIQ